MFRRVKHRATVPSSKGPTTIVAALSPPCAITQATARQHWNYDTAPFLRGHVIRDEEPAPASPAYISILATFIQELNDVRQVLAFTEDFAIKRGAQFTELNRLQPYLAASYI
jgi:hypothetical protein